jgi:iron compound ABC transporter, periplasmic iron compound-binding protein, putative
MKNIVNKKYFNLLLILLLALLLSACGTQKPTNESDTSDTTAASEALSSKIQSSEVAENTSDYYPVTIQTYRHSKEPVELVFEKMPERLYAVNPSSVENMIALGLEDKIVKVSLGSRDRLTDAGKALYDKLGGQKETLSKEEILNNNIDFIIGWYSTFDDKSLGEVDYWHEKGIKTYIALNSSIKKPAPNTLEDEYEDIRNLGKIFNVEDRAEALIAEMDKKIASAQEKVKEKGKTRVIVLEVEKENQLRLYGPETIGGIIAEKVGADLLTNEQTITAEELINLNPDVIFSVYFGPDTDLTEESCVQKLMDNPALKSISAIQNQRVYPITLSYTYATGARTLEAINYISDILYPELTQ